MCDKSSSGYRFPQGGLYEYRRKGLLDEVPHVLLYTGVVIIRAEDERRLTRELRPYEAQVHRRWVYLEASDARALAEGWVWTWRQA